MSLLSQWFSGKPRKGGLCFLVSPGGYSPWHPGFGLHCRPNPSSSRCGLQLSQDRIEVGFRQCESFGDGGPRCLKRVFGCGLIPGLGDVVQWILCSLGDKCHSWNQSFFNWRCFLHELNDPVWLKGATWKLEASRTSHLSFCCKSPVRPHWDLTWNPVRMDRCISYWHIGTELCRKKNVACLNIPGVEQYPRSGSSEWKFAT